MATSRYISNITGPTNPVEQSGAADEEHSVLQRIPYTATTATAMHQGRYRGCPEGCAGTTSYLEIFSIRPPPLLPPRDRSGTRT